MAQIRLLVAMNRSHYDESLQLQMEATASIDVIGFAARPSETLLLTGELLADVVLLSAGKQGGPPGICSHLLYEYPELVVIVVAESGDSATLYRRTTTAERYGELKKTGLQPLFSGLGKERVSNPDEPQGFHHA